jgi:IMP dehydrogenase
MAMGLKISSEDEFHGKSYRDDVLIAEGVEGLVPVNGSIAERAAQLVGGLISGMYYVGCKDITQLHKKAQFYQVTHASLSESHPHDLYITDGGKNYQEK